ncbi:AsnC family transcriptional regulator [Leucobacter luti]|uniref:DNA-binding Lrp family transcriptional regulator n=1 Tax=Leucobacter luti TaxID=340320 RepID=A0A4Q7TUA3_9MICO|nr:AsnC family transcriptional regulator [Leucobacter luti]RZT64514.1 DNA-binding Lrp family transcriptional regulator [Leucobacter luti]
MTEITLDALDFQIIHALQIEPRVRWTALAAVLGADAHTLARRWQRIEEGGAAWFTAMQGVSQLDAMALIEVDSHPGQVLDAARAIAALPGVASIELATGACDLFVTLLAEDEDELAAFLLERISEVPQVRGVRSHLISQVAREGSDWTLQVLSDAQVRSIPPIRPPRAGAAKRVDPRLALAIRQALQTNVRMPVGELGERVGVSAQRAADALARLRLDGLLQLRTDMSERFTLYPAVNWLFLQLPAPRVAGALDKVITLNAVQFAAVSTGPANVILAVGAKNRIGLLAAEISVSQLIPEAEVKDRMTMLRLYKHLGREVNGFEAAPR